MGSIAEETETLYKHGTSVLRIRLDFEQTVLILSMTTPGIFSFL